MSFRSTLIAATALPYKRRLQYLESTGTQYIDTGIVPSLDTTVDIACHYDSSITGDISIFGCRDSDRSNNRYMIWQTTSDNHRPRFDFGTTYVTAEASSFAYPITQLKKDGRLNYINNNNVRNNNPIDSLNCSASAYLFWARYGNSKAVAKVFRTKIWQNGVLSRDLIPVLDFSNVACMYDQVTGQFFCNAGSGNFLYA